MPPVTVSTIFFLKGWSPGPTVLRFRLGSALNHGDLFVWCVLLLIKVLVVETKLVALLLTLGAEPLAFRDVSQWGVEASGVVRLVALRWSVRNHISHAHSFTLEKRVIGEVLVADETVGGRFDLDGETVQLGERVIRAGKEESTKQATSDAVMLAWSDKTVLTRRRRYLPGVGWLEAWWSSCQCWGRSQVLPVRCVPEAQSYLHRELPGPSRCSGFCRRTEG